MTQLRPSTVGGTSRRTGPCPLPLRRRPGDLEPRPPATGPSPLRDPPANRTWRRRRASAAPPARRQVEPLRLRHRPHPHRRPAAAPGSGSRFGGSARHDRRPRHARPLYIGRLPPRRPPGADPDEEPTPRNVKGQVAIGWSGAPPSSPFTACSTTTAPFRTMTPSSSSSHRDRKDADPPRPVAIVLAIRACCWPQHAGVPPTRAGGAVAAVRRGAAPQMVVMTSSGRSRRRREVEVADIVRRRMSSS